MECKIFTLGFLLILITARLKAQSNQFQFSHLDINGGLSHNDVTSIFKDKKGFMWFGTISGLNRYDGYKLICALWYRSYNGSNCRPSGGTMGKERQRAHHLLGGRKRMLR
jgi:ligand-binding sensor domain-containing protein